MGLPAVRLLYCRSMERVCEGCAREDDDLVLVRRLYPAPGGAQAAAADDSAPELWCFSCRSLYPHVVEEE